MVKSASAPSSRPQVVPPPAVVPLTNSDLDATGLGSTGLTATGLGPAGLDTSGLNTSGLNTSTLDPKTTAAGSPRRPVGQAKAAQGAFPPSSLLTLPPAGLSSGVSPVASASSPAGLQWQRRPPLRFRHHFFQGMRWGVGLCLMVGSVGVIWQRQQIVTSEQGFINGRILPIQAPITGEMTLSALQPGDRLHRGQILGKIENLRNPALEIQRQQLQSRLAGLDQQVQLLQAREAQRRSLLAEVRQDRGTQKRWVGHFDMAQLDRLRAEIAELQTQQAAATREAQRMYELAEAGAIARMVADRAQDELQSARLKVSAKQAELQQALADQKARQQGLQLEGAQGMSYPELRSRELRQELADLNLENNQVRSQRHQAQLELQTLTQQLSLQKQAPLKAPSSGILWSVEASTPDRPVQAQETLAQVIDCSQTWVDTFVSERELRHLQVGDTVQIQILGQGKAVYPGRIRSVRAGVGRVEAGAVVAVPPPLDVHRQVGVRIAWQTVTPVASQDFCGVGQSVSVQFNKRAQGETLSLPSFISAFF